MEQPRHSTVSTARQRVEVKVERHQLFLLFIIGLVVIALIFAVGVMTGKRLTDLAVAADCPKGDLKGVDKAAEVEKALRKNELPPTPGGAAPGGTLAQLAATAREKETPAARAEKAMKESAPEKPAKEAKTAPEKEKADVAKASADKPAKNGKGEGAGPAVKEPPAAGARRTDGSSVIPSDAPEGAAGGDAEFTLQIAALPDRNQAVSLAAQMEKKGYRSHISTVQVPDKGTMYRVRVGHFKTKDEAAAFRDEFQKKENRAGFVTPTK